MAYTPDPDKVPAPVAVRAVIAWACAFAALFLFLPVIVRTLFRLAGAA